MPSWWLAKHRQCAGCWWSSNPFTKHDKMEVVLSDDVTRLMVDVAMFIGKRIKNINKHTLTSETRNHKKPRWQNPWKPRLLVGSALSCGTLKSTLMKTRLPLTSTSLMLSLAGMVKAKQQNGDFLGERFEPKLLRTLRISNLFGPPVSSARSNKGVRVLVSTMLQWACETYWLIAFMKILPISSTAICHVFDIPETWCRRHWKCSWDTQASTSAT